MSSLACSSRSWLIKHFLPSVVLTLTACSKVVFTVHCCRSGKRRLVLRVPLNVFTICTSAHARLSDTRRSFKSLLPHDRKVVALPGLEVDPLQSQLPVYLKWKLARVRTLLIVPVEYLTPLLRPVLRVDNLVTLPGIALRRGIVLRHQGDPHLIPLTHPLYVS